MKEPELIYSQLIDYEESLRGYHIMRNCGVPHRQAKQIVITNPLDSISREFYVFLTTQSKKGNQ